MMKKHKMNLATEKTMALAEYLKKPYGRFVVPESDGTFRSEIIEFPGCIAVGETAAEALANLEDVAASWLEATLARGQRIPEPIENVGFSGKLVVRLPKTLHKKAAHMAAHDGISLNQFIVSSVAEQIGARSSTASIGKFQSFLGCAGSLVFAPVAFQVLDPRFAPMAQQIIASSSGNPVTGLHMERVDA
jgi:antitoxin HicB